MCAGGHEAQRRSFRQERGADHKGKFWAAALHSAALLTLAMLARGGQRTAVQIGPILQRAWSNKGRLHNSPSSIQVGYFFGGCKKTGRTGSRPVLVHLAPKEVSCAAQACLNAMAPANDLGRVRTAWPSLPLCTIH